MGWLVITRYLQLEVEKGATGLSHEAAAFTPSQHSAYTPVVLILLKGITDFSVLQFSKNLIWVIPLLSQLILADDSNIRFAVSNIYTKHIDHILFSVLN